MKQEAEIRKAANEAAIQIDKAVEILSAAASISDTKRLRLTLVADRLRMEIADLAELVNSENGKSR